MQRTHCPYSHERLARTHTHSLVAHVNGHRKHFNCAVRALLDCSMDLSLSAKPTHSHARQPQFLAKVFMYVPHANHLAILDNIGAYGRHRAKYLLYWNKVLAYERKSAFYRKPAEFGQNSASPFGAPHWAKCMGRCFRGFTAILMWSITLNKFVNFYYTPCTQWLPKPIRPGLHTDENARNQSRSLSHTAKYLWKVFKMVLSCRFYKKKFPEVRIRRFSN